MTALLVIVGVIAYLAIGGIAAAVHSRLDSVGSDPFLRGILVMFWPAFASTGCLYGAAWLVGIGSLRVGEWIVGLAASLGKSRAERIQERAIRRAVVEAVKRRIQ